MRLVVPRGIEPLIPPWKGGVLTAWPWDHVPTFGAVIICTRVCKFLLCRSRHIIWGTTDLFFLIAPFPFSKRLRSEILHKCLKCLWWRWVESNYRSIGYEPIALTAEPHRQDYEYIIHNNKANVKSFFKILKIYLKHCNL